MKLCNLIDLYNRFTKYVKGECNVFQEVLKEKKLELECILFRLAFFLRITKKVSINLKILVKPWSQSAVHLSVADFVEKACVGHTGLHVFRRYYLWWSTTRKYDVCNQYRHLHGFASLPRKTEIFN